MDDLYMMGIDRETYEKLLVKAKLENRSVADVVAEALRRTTDKLEESKAEPKLLMEG